MDAPAYKLLLTHVSLVESETGHTSYLFHRFFRNLVLVQTSVEKADSQAYVVGNGIFTRKPFQQD